MAHDDDEVGHRHGLALVVRHDDGRDAQPLLQLAQFDLHGFAQLGVERRHRLVEQEQFRGKRERAGDRHALALSAGELGDRTVGEAGKWTSLSRSSARFFCSSFDAPRMASE